MDHVTLKTAAIMLKSQLCHQGNKLYFQIYSNAKKKNVLNYNNVSQY